MYYHLVLLSFFFFNDTATTEIYTLSLHDALPIYVFAAALFTLGLSAWQVTSSIFVGCCIIFAGCCMSGFMGREDRKSTRLNSSHANISYAVFCLKKKKYKP